MHVTVLYYSPWDWSTVTIAVATRAVHDWLLTWFMGWYYVLTMAGKIKSIIRTHKLHLTSWTDGKKFLNRSSDPSMSPVHFRECFTSALSGKSLKQNIHRSTGSPHTSWLPSTPSPTSDSYKIIMKDWSWYNFILIESTCMCTNMTTVPCKVCATGLRAHWLINPAFNLNRGDESFDSHYQYKCWSHSGYVGDHLFLF